MKLAEALIIRADTQKRLAQLRERLARVAKIQEGDKPAEDPDALLQEHRHLLNQYLEIIQRVNRTNAATPFDGRRTLTDALAERDVIAMERASLTALIEYSAAPNYRYGRSEIKFFSTINIANIQKQIDDLSKRYRELDVAIQQLNWNVELI